MGCANVRRTEKGKQANRTVRLLYRQAVVGPALLSPSGGGGLAQRSSGASTAGSLAPSQYIRRTSSEWLGFPSRPNQLGAGVGKVSQI